MRLAFLPAFLLATLLGGCPDPNTDVDPDTEVTSDTELTSDTDVGSDSDTETALVADCPDSLIECDDLCADPARDRRYCGATGDCMGENSGVACDAGEVCDDGLCVLSCPSTMLACDDRCVDPLVSRDACGATSCTDGDVCVDGEVCASGTCALSCPTDLLECDGGCVDPDRDRRWCGATGDCTGDNAGATCDSGEICEEGACITTCRAPTISCDETCVDPSVSDIFCGASGDCVGENAGLACTSDQECSVGTCAPTAGWTNPVVIDDSDDRFARAANPTAAIDGAGNAVILWREQEQGEALRSTQYTALDATWSASTVVVDDRPESVRLETVAMSSGGLGRAGVAFAQFRTASGDWRNHYVARQRSNGTWARTTLYDLFFPNSSQFAIAADDNDNALALYRRDVNGDRLRSRYWNSSAQTWEGDRLVDDGTAETSSPVVLLDGDGNGLALWIEARDGAASLVSNTYSPLAGVWATPTLIEEDAGAVSAPALDLHSDGTGVAVWLQVRSETRDVVAAHYDGTAWGDPVVVDAGAEDAANPDVAIDADGVAHAVWRRSDGTATTAYTSSRSATGEWSTAVALESSDAPVGPPMIGADDHGAVMALWLQSDGDAQSVYYARRPLVPGTWLAPQTVESSSDGAGQLTFAMSSGGTAVAAWRANQRIHAAIWR